MAPDPLLPWLFTARICLNASALVAIGLALHAGLGVLERESRRPALRLATGTAVVAAVFGAARLAFLAAELGDASSPENIALAWTAFGPAILSMCAGALAIALSNVRGLVFLAPGGGVAVAASFALTGHTQGLNNPGIMPALAALHVFIAGFWVAAPLCLWPMRNLADELLTGRLKRFSGIATVAIPILLALGMSLGWVLARGSDGLLTTLYGRLLLLKLVASLLALAMGALNHQVVARLVASKPAHGRKWLATTLVVEVGMFVAAVVIVSAATTFVGPGQN